MCAPLKVLINMVTAIICWTLPPHFKRAVAPFAFLTIKNAFSCLLLSQVLERLNEPRGLLQSHE